MEPKHWRCSQCRLGTLNTLLACLLACLLCCWVAGPRAVVCEVPAGQLESSTLRLDLTILASPLDTEGCDHL